MKTQYVLNTLAILRNLLPDIDNLYIRNFCELKQNLDFYEMADPGGFEPPTP